MIEEYIDSKYASVLQSLHGRKTMMVHELKPLLPSMAFAWCKAEAAERVILEWKSTGFTSQALSSSMETRRVVQGTIGSLLPFIAFAGESLEDTIREAIRFAGRYVCQPRRTLTAQAFRGSPTVTFELLELRLSAAVEYRYLPALLLQALRGESEISPGRFQNTLTGIDDAAVRQHSPEEFARLMTPMAEWFSEPGSKATSVPVEAILAFLEDKGKTVMRDYIRSIARIRTRTAMDFAEIASLVNDLEVSENAVAAEVSFPARTTSESTLQRPVVEAQPEPPEIQPASDMKPEEPQVESMPAEEPRAALESVATPSPTETPEESVVPLSFEEERNDLLAEARQAEYTSAGIAPEQANEPADNPAESEPEPLPSTVEQAPVENVAPPPPVEPRLSFPSDLRLRLAASLFHGNTAYFDATLEELNKLSTWREAAGYLTDLLEINRLNPYATDVMQFTDTIRRWFVREDEEQTE